MLLKCGHTHEQPDRTKMCVVAAQPFHLPLQSKHASSHVVISCPILPPRDVTGRKNAQLCSRMYPAAKWLALLQTKHSLAWRELYFLIKTSYICKQIGTAGFQFDRLKFSGKYTYHLPQI
jgi:hypothetical protein